MMTTSLLSPIKGHSIEVTAKITGYSWMTYKTYCFPEGTTQEAIYRHFSEEIARHYNSTDETLKIQVTNHRHVPIVQAMNAVA